MNTICDRKRNYLRFLAHFSAPLFNAEEKSSAPLVLLRRNTYLCTRIKEFTNSNIMLIDFEKIAEVHIENFKGGNGKLDTRNYQDENVKIMYSTLRPHASTGLHTHLGNSEIVYIISGTATFHYDDTIEEVRAGQVHYCPMNHSHYMENLTDHDLVYFAIVPERQ